MGGRRGSSAAEIGAWLGQDTSVAYRQNLATLEGRELGVELARLCDVEAGRQQLKRERCGTCAFRHGDHIANGSLETLMDALKCVMERTIFWCHEVDRPCVGWRLLVSPVNVPMPWTTTGGVD